MPRRLALLAAVLAAVSASVATPARAGAASLTARLDRSLRAAGPHTGAMIADLTAGGRTIYARRAGVRRLPASTEKLWTTATALRRFGPGYTFRTAVYAARAPSAAGVVRGDLYLRGGGDPNLSVKDIAVLASALRRAGVRRVTGRVVGDESRFDSLRGVPSSAVGPSPDVEPLSALVYDRDVSGYRYVSSPPRYAASALSLALGRIGVAVTNRRHPGAGRTPAGALRLAVTGSPPLRTLVALTNRPSDNLYAETLLKDLGASFGARGSTAAGAAVVRAEAARLGLHPRVLDGSGLSRRDATSPAQLVGLLTALRANGDLRASLAHFGRRGDTLEDRLRGTDATRRCAAKTGSLHDVSALAGYCTSRAGHLLAFAILMNRISSVTYARTLQDRMVLTLLSAPAPRAPAPGPPPGGGAPPRR